MSQGLGSVERDLLAGLAKKAWLVGTRHAGMTSHELPVLPSSPYPNTTGPRRRAMASLERKGWAIRQQTPVQVDYYSAARRLRIAAGADVETEPGTTRRLLSVIYLRHDSPLDLIEDKLSDRIRATFQACFTARKKHASTEGAHGPKGFGSSLRQLDDSKHVEDFLDRERVLWRDCMGAGLGVLEVYTRWEAAQGGICSCDLTYSDGS